VVTADDELEATLGLLRRAAREVATAQRLEVDAESRLLQSVVDTAVLLFDAEAASIALFEPDPDRLEYRVASGAQGRAVVGLTVAPDLGIAGLAFTTGKAIASSDVAADPRWDQGAAARTGYLPRSIAAEPLIDEDRTLGVLQVLDKRSSPAFTDRDIALLAVFARQASVAIRAARAGRDPEHLLHGALAAVSGGVLEPAAEQAVLDAVADQLDTRPSAYWGLVDQVAELTSGPRTDLELVDRILATVARHREA
jgi:GAF domain-containing protein